MTSAASNMANISIVHMLIAASNKYNIKTNNVPMKSTASNMADKHYSLEINIQHHNKVYMADNNCPFDIITPNK